MKQKVLIVEDEPYVRDEMRFLLSRYPRLEIVGEADNSFDAICLVQSLLPDIVFLDIKLGTVDGIKLAQRIKELNPAIQIVFATAYDNYAVEGFELNAADYLLKPISEERLSRTVERLLQDGPANAVNAEPPAEPQGSDKLIVKQKQIWKLLDLADILYFQSGDHITEVHTRTDAYTLSSTLRELEWQLPPARFLRTHKSFIVNVDHINEIVPWFNYTFQILLRGIDVQIPVSRNYVKKFKSILL